MDPDPDAAPFAQSGAELVNLLHQFHGQEASRVLLAPRIVPR
jgi:hypothetical protein